jgi:hypothetical protein
MRRVPAILMVIFLVFPLLFTALMTISVSTWVLDRGFYRGIIDDQRLYEMPDPAGSVRWLETQESGLGGLSMQSALKASREILTPGYMRTQALRVLDQVFDFLGGRTGRFDFAVDLAPVKAALLGDPGKRFARILAQDLPVGGTAADFRVTPGKLPLSRPSTLSVDRAAAIITEGLPTYVQSIPDMFRLSDDPSFHYATWGPGFSALGALVLADLVLLVFGGGLWTAAAFVGGANRFERLQWFGWTLFAPAAAVFLIGLLTTLGLVSGWAAWGIETARLESQGFSATFITALVDAVRHAITRVGTGFLATGAIAGGAAMGLLAWSWTIERDQGKGAAS